MSTTRTIIVQCKRQESEHAKLSLSQSYLVIEYGNFVADDQFSEVDREIIWLEEFPELRTLHDGRGWNTESLFSTVACVSSFHFYDDGETQVPLAELLKIAQKKKA